MMKKLILILTLLFLPSFAFATSGCCSWHGGVDTCDPSGRYACNDGTLSPSCGCTYVAPKPIKLFTDTSLGNLLTTNPLSSENETLKKENTELKLKVDKCTSDLKAEQNKSWWTKLWEWIF
jgi:hypothetical protein